MPRIAILDLGTNTFNLLIAEKDEQGNPVFIYSKELPVEIGKGGIHRREITPEATQRAVRALLNHGQKMHEFNVDEYYAFATSAVRDAANGKDFTRRMRIETGIEIKILSGEEEAEWIYEGVKLTGLLGKEPSLIMDIGGGSTEFIIADRNEIFWKRSYPLGVSRLYEIFHPADPIVTKKVEVEKHILTMLQDLFEAAEVHKPVELIGSSGSFESFAEMIINRTASPEKPVNGYEIPLNEFEKLYNNIITSTVEERLQMPGLIQMRAPMFSYSVVLTDLTIRKLSIKKMTLSRYAMKEGIAHRLLAAMG
ncbi:MAG TPA: phosphatase [Bacteroidia bacterium]|nr:phosphatase [Bacteroidia bacterium]